MKKYKQKVLKYWKQYKKLMKSGRLQKVVKTFLPKPEKKGLKKN